MVFVGIFMMPFYYGSRARSVPEYLKLRFDEKTRGLNAVSFAAMTVFSSGISMYAMGKLAAISCLGLGLHTCLCSLSAAIVLVYIYLGGLTSAIYNEVLQFFLIVFGLRAAGLSRPATMSAGGRAVGEAASDAVARGLRSGRADPGVAAHGQPGATNPMGVEWFGLVMGLGFVLSFGYWCTDFLVVQRAMAADSMTAARRTPLIAAIPKMFFPFLVILPGMIALAVPAPSSVGFAQQQHVTYLSDATAQIGSPAIPTVQHSLIPPKLDSRGQPEVDTQGRVALDYDLATPMMLVQLFPSGMLGLGLTALLASFMSGMAGNVTAFNTVWTYDIYQSYIKPGASDAHYLWMGRVGDGLRHPALGRGGVRGPAVQQHHGPAAARVRVRERAAVRDVRARHVLEARDRTRRVHRAARRHARAALHHGLTLPAGAVVGVKGGYLGVAAHVPERDGAELLDGDRRVDDVLPGDDSGVDLFTSRGATRS